MTPNAGATMEEETGDMNVKDETTNVAAHFRFMLQFFGFRGSCGPSHVTKFGSCVERVERCDRAFPSRGCASKSRSLSFGMPYLTSSTGDSTSSLGPLPSLSSF